MKRQLRSKNTPTGPMWECQECKRLIQDVEDGCDCSSNHSKEKSQ